MSEEKKLSIDFTQFLLRCTAEDLEASKELLGTGSPLSGDASREAAKLLKAIANGLERAVVVDTPVITAIDAGAGEPKFAISGMQLVICAEWPR